MKTLPYIRSALLMTALTILSSGSVWADPAVDAASAVEKAEAERQKAASVGGEWRGVAQMIQEARTAVQRGDVVAAQHLASQAYHQGELGYRQAVQQKNADFPDYLR